MQNFWLRSKQKSSPLTVLAPMEDVTDTVFRRVIIHCGGPNVLFTEFTNVEGLNSVGQAKLIHRLQFDPLERPIVAQVWGITPEDYYKAAQLVLELGFDGIDINMGCPVKNVIKQGACSALIKNPDLAKEIVEATKSALNNQIPLSIKTRIGFESVETDKWATFLLRECRPNALTIHGRTVKEESRVPCHFEEIGKVVQINSQIKQQNLNILKAKSPSEKGVIVRLWLKEKLLEL